MSLLSCVKADLFKLFVKLDHVVSKYCTSMAIIFNFCWYEKEGSQKCEWEQEIKTSWHGYWSSAICCWSVKFTLGVSVALTCSLRTSQLCSLCPSCWVKPCLVHIWAHLWTPHQMTAAFFSSFKFSPCRWDSAPSLRLVRGWWHQWWLFDEQLLHQWHLPTPPFSIGLCSQKTER